jgi:outer membrane biogenesis lipoprotein LolB
MRGGRLMRHSLALLAVAILTACTARPGPVTQPSTSLQPQSVDWSAAKECRGRPI